MKRQGENLEKKYTYIEDIKPESKIEVVESRNEFYTVKDCISKYYTYCAIVSNIAEYYGDAEQNVLTEAKKENAQPMVVRHKKGNLAVVHNGNLINAGELRAEIEEEGHIFTTTTDTEVICHVIVQERMKTKSIEEAIEIYSRGYFKRQKNRGTYKF